jgi:phosphate transport system protein
MVAGYCKRPQKKRISQNHGFMAVETTKALRRFSRKRGNSMTRELFHRHLQELEDIVDKLGALVVKAISRSLEVLQARDILEAQNVIKDDIHINKKRWEIEDKCIDLIGTQQPVAKDLRELVALIHIATELERMGDHAKGIASITIKMGDLPFVKPLVIIPQMAEKAKGMLQRSLEAFHKRDARSAILVLDEDEEMDKFYNEVYHKLIRCMIEEPEKVAGATHLLWVAHDLERIGDRVTNICERTIFLLKGKKIENIPEHALHYRVVEAFRTGEL